jgi:hypothetical protein
MWSGRIGPFHTVGFDGLEVRRTEDQIDGLEVRRTRAPYFRMSNKLLNWSVQSGPDMSRSASPWPVARIRG